ncbi:MAG: hypothetical protein AAF501_04515 [Pseudomonadota bacterium]
MKYDAPIKMGPLEFSSLEMVILAALLPVVIAVLVGLRRDTALIAGILGAIAMMATR